MNSWDSVATVLLTAWQHLAIPLLYTTAPLIFSASIGYFLISRRARREAEIQRLKTQIINLRQSLDFIQATTVARPVELDGPGPFQLPILTQMNWLSPRREESLIAGFRSEDGRRIFATIAYRAIAQLLNDDRSMPLDKTHFSTTTSVDLAKPADVHELPVLPRFEGHLQRGPDLRILVFSSEQGRKILLPVSFETYKELLRQFESALVAHQKEKTNALKSFLPKRP
jgi:hypothetical protein